MLCLRPLIKINDIKMKHKYQNKSFINYLTLSDYHKKNIHSYLKNESIEIFPCKKCVACQNMNRFHWTKRMFYESKKWDYTYFITLTFNNENLPLELSVKDIQKFIKYLRNKISPYEIVEYKGKKFRKYDYSVWPLKYFATGEYGEKRKRPHYHLIIFTDYKLDLVFLKETKDGNKLYTCKMLETCWKNKGFICVGFDSGNKSFNYASSYSCKSLSKQALNIDKAIFEKNKKSIYEVPNISGFTKYLLVDKLIDEKLVKPFPEFICMSKSPPIGAGWDKMDPDVPKSLLDYWDREWLKENFPDFDKEKTIKENYISSGLDYSYFKMTAKKRYFDFLNSMCYNNVAGSLSSNSTSLIGSEKIKRKLKDNIN